MRTGRLISALVATGALAIVPALAGAPVAHATAGDLVCNGGFIDANLGPGMTFQTKTVQVTGEGDLGQCTSNNDSTLAGGTFTFQATIQGECPNGGNGNATGTVSWNNGKTSKVEGTFVVDQNQVGMSNVHVLSGEFAGDSGSFAGPITNLPWYECLFPTGVEYGRSILNEAFLN
jgi:polyisoprenoid-binding protein YceI